MIDATKLYGAEGDRDPLRSEFEKARASLDGAEWWRGLDELEALSERGSILSTLCVAGCLLEGWGYDQDLIRAESSYRVAAESGSAAGLFGLGLTHIRMGKSADAAEELREAVLRNYKPAYNALAYLYSRGEGVPLNKKEALDLWRRGAREGHLAAKHGTTYALLQG